DTLPENKSAIGCKRSGNLNSAPMHFIHSILTIIRFKLRSKFKISRIGHIPKF
ncbi:41879_t:CDS:2, partial [Gigaspora margarita]